MNVTPLEQKLIETLREYINTSVAQQVAQQNKAKNPEEIFEAFAADCLKVTRDAKDSLKKSDAMNEFKSWFLDTHGDAKKTPKGIEFYEYMDKRFGKCTYKGWRGVQMRTQENVEEFIDLVDLVE